MHTNISIIGSGGQSKVVLEELLNLDLILKVNFFDEKVVPNNQNFPNEKKIKILHDFEELDKFFHVAIGANDVRRRISQSAIGIGKRPYSIVSNRSITSQSAKVSDGCFIASNALIGPDSMIGQSVIINHSAVVDHDCIIDDYCHIAPNSTLCGNVHIGENSLIGAGATVLPGISIGRNSIIGAGATITKNVGDNQIMF